MTTPDNDEQQPGRWGSNRFIIILIGIVIGVLAMSLLRGTAGQGELQTPSASSQNQPADSPQP